MSFLVLHISSPGSAVNPSLPFVLSFFVLFPSKSLSFVHHRLTVAFYSNQSSISSHEINIVINFELEVLESLLTCALHDSPQFPVPPQLCIRNSCIIDWPHLA